MVMSKSVYYNVSRLLRDIFGSKIRSHVQWVQNWRNTGTHSKGDPRLVAMDTLGGFHPQTCGWLGLDELDECAGLGSRTH